MFIYFKQKRKNLPFRCLSTLIAFVLSFSLVFSPTASYAQAIIPQTVLNLPVPGTMVPLSAGFMPALVRGITIHPENPLKFNFIIDSGDSGLDGKKLNEESKKLIKYFLASLTVPEEELWVNLSPYEKDRVIPDRFGDTEMGWDLLAQDYILKQLTASLMYPEDELGQKFWERVYTKAQEMYGTTEIPMNTFNKVWIVPEEAVVYEHGTSAFVIDSHLKVMLEEDYLALQNNLDNKKYGMDQLGESDVEVLSGVSSEIVKEVLIPEIEREVNEGKTFTQLRQIYNSSILAIWYKQNLKESLLGQVYVDKNKTKGIDVEDKTIKEKIYNQYLEAFKKGVYNYIKEDYDPASQQMIPRKYFSGGTRIGSSPIQRTIRDKDFPFSFADRKRIKTASNPTSEGSKIKDYAINLQEVGEEADPEQIALLSNLTFTKETAFTPEEEILRYYEKQLEDVQVPGEELKEVKTASSPVEEKSGEEGDNSISTFAVSKMPIFKEIHELTMQEVGSDIANKNVLLLLGHHRTPAVEVLIHYLNEIGVELASYFGITYAKINDELANRLLRVSNQKMVSLKTDDKGNVIGLDEHHTGNNIPGLSQLKQKIAETDHYNYVDLTKITAKHLLIEAARKANAENRKLVILEVAGYYYRLLHELYYSEGEDARIIRDLVENQRLLAVLVETEKGHRDHEETMQRFEPIAVSISGARTLYKKAYDSRHIAESNLRAAYQAVLHMAHQNIFKMPALIIGGRGAIGRHMISHLGPENPYRNISPLIVDRQIEFFDLGLPKDEFEHIYRYYVEPINQLREDVDFTQVDTVQEALKRGVEFIVGITGESVIMPYQLRPFFDSNSKNLILVSASYDDIEFMDLKQFLEKIVREDSISKDDLTKVFGDKVKAVSRNVSEYDGRMIGAIYTFVLANGQEKKIYLVGNGYPVNFAWVNEGGVPSEIIDGIIASQYLTVVNFIRKGLSLPNGIYSPDSAKLFSEKKLLLSRLEKKLKQQGGLSGTASFIVEGFVKESGKSSSPIDASSWKEYLRLPMLPDISRPARDPDIVKREIIERVSMLPGYSAVFIGGPIAAGKSSLMKMIQAELGERSVVFPLDEYYKPDSQRPKTATGETDIAHPHGLKLAQARLDIEALLRGERIELPHYDMQKDQAQTKSGNYLQLRKNDVLLVDGVYALHEELLSGVDKLKAFKVFIDAPAIIRLLRRLKRDVKERQIPYEKTLWRWPNGLIHDQRDTLPTQLRADIILENYTAQEGISLQKEFERLIAESLKDKRDPGQVIELLDLWRQAIQESLASTASSPIINMAEEFEKVEGLGSGIPAILIVKGEDTSDLSERFSALIRADQDGKSDFYVLKRTESKKGFVALTMLGTKIDINQNLWKREGLEPRGFAVQGDLMVIGFVDELHVISITDGKLLKVIRNPKLKLIHTIEFSPENPNRILVSSTGADRILELDIMTGDIVWEWNPWVHGYSRNKLGLTIVTKGDPIPTGTNVRVVTHQEAEQMMARGEMVPGGEVLVSVVDFGTIVSPLGIERWQNVAAANWAGYGKTPDKILATLLHANKAVEIDKGTGNVRVLFDDLNKPHGIISFQEGYLISDTLRGRVLLFDENFHIKKIFSFSDLPLEAGQEEQFYEWIQFTSPIGESFLATVDSRRKKVFIWDPQGKIYSEYSYNPNWHIQAIVPFTPEAVVARPGLRVTYDQLTTSVGRTLRTGHEGELSVWFSEIFDGQFNFEDQVTIQNAVANSGGRLILLTREEILKGRLQKQMGDRIVDIGVAGSVPLILEDFNSLTNEEKKQIEKLHGQFYEDWGDHLEGVDQVWVAAAGLLRIKIGDKYLLMRNTKDNPDGSWRYLPIGGAFKYHDINRPALEAMGAREFEGDQKTPRLNDLRFILQKGRLEEFEMWFQSRKGRETDPIREIREEMVNELGIFNSEYFDSLLKVSEDMGPASSPLSTESRAIEQKKGGIDLNPVLLDLQIKRDGNGVPLPLPQQPIYDMRIDGFVPVIINVTPVTNLPFLLGIADQEQESNETNFNLSLQPMEKRNRFKSRHSKQIVLS